MSSFSKECKLHDRRFETNNMLVMGLSVLFYDMITRCSEQHKAMDAAKKSGVLLELQSRYVGRESSDNTRHFPGSKIKLRSSHGASFDIAIMLS